VQESPSWQLQVGTPAPVIAGDVFVIAGYEEHVARPVRRLEIKLGGNGCAGHSVLQTELRAAS